MSQAAIDWIIDRAMAGADTAEVQEGDICQCCGKNPSVGVAAIPYVPMSIAWCLECLRAAVVPLWVCFAQATSGIEDMPPLDHPPVDRGMFNEGWLEFHDRTLAKFGVTEEEFWTAVNTPPPPCGPTGDDQFCACGCGGDDSRCEVYLYFYRATEEQVPETHTCCKIPDR